MDPEPNKKTKGEEEVDRFVCSICYKKDHISAMHMVPTNGKSMVLCDECYAKLKSRLEDLKSRLEDLRKAITVARLK